MSDQQDHSNHHNRGGMIAFMFSMVFVFVFFFYLVAIHKGVDLDEKVVDPHAPVAANAKPAFDVSTVKEPWVSSPEMVEYGHKVFNTNCSMCHGQEGKGDGPAGMSLNPHPRNLVEGKWTQGAGPIAHFKVATGGIPGTSMAPFGHLKVADRWAVVQFIQSITQNKGSDDPAKVAEFAKTAK
jgi:mono/diheme cytochrome c family protein